MRARAIIILLVLSCSKKSKDECFSHWVSIFDQKLTLGCDKTIKFYRPAPSECSLSGSYDEAPNGAIVWHISETCAGVKTTEATNPDCHLSGNEEFKNFGCNDLGINQTFYREK